MRNETQHQTQHQTRRTIPSCMSNPYNKIALLRFTPTDSIQTLSDITMNTGKFPVGLLGFATAQPNLLLLVVKASIIECLYAFEMRRRNRWQVDTRGKFLDLRRVFYPGNRRVDVPVH